jgi:hypothetical protein
MQTDRTPHLLIQTCAQCDEIAVREMPELLCAIEDRFGFDVLKAFLFEFGGRQYSISIRPNARRKQSALSDLHDWLHERCVAGTIPVPMGNLALQTRIAWTVAVHLRDGLSLAATARAVACEVRTVSGHKKRLVKIGWLRAALPNPERKAS